MNNKSIKICISAAFIALSVSSCTDLDVDVKSQYTSYPNSEIAVEAKTSDVYFAFRGHWGVVIMKPWFAHPMSVRV